MKNREKEMKIVKGTDKTITRRELFKAKERFHKNQAKMPFEEKIAVLVELQKISSSIRPAENKIIWKI